MTCLITGSFIPARIVKVRMKDGIDKLYEEGKSKKITWSKEKINKIVKLYCRETEGEKRSVNRKLEAKRK